MKSCLPLLLLAGLAACRPPAAPQLPSVASGRVVRHADFPSRHVDARHVDVWLPAGYSPAQRYAVLYMHDGQMLFDSTTTWNRQEWKADETAGRLIASGQIPPCIVVGVWNNGEYRAAEYFPEAPLDSLAPAQREAGLAAHFKGGKALADEYLLFLTQELKPWIDSAYSTLPDAAHTFVMGSSMGGLISMYALCEYPEVFGGAACLSVHWPMGRPDKLDEGPLRAAQEAFFAYLRSSLPLRQGNRLYYDIGTETLDSLYLPYQLRADSMLAGLEFPAGSWRSEIYEGTDHSERSWAGRLEVPMVFLMGKE
ncbi:MAG: alpha/beta hydrolase-fold protein [Bacteroidia bacterium]|nr:alpha/beta hydrolase-fold protein [Bacteroidia bacterium]